jgi:hypothetical protein
VGDLKAVLTSHSKGNTVKVAIATKSINCGIFLKLFNASNLGFLFFMIKREFSSSPFTRGIEGDL